MTKTHMTKKFHTQKIFLQPMPQKNFTTIKIFSHIHTQLPNFSIVMQKKKNFPHDQDSLKKNSHKLMHK